MKRCILFISVLMFSLYLNGCKGEFFGPGMGDFSYKLSGTYTLVNHGGATSGGAEIWKDDGMKKVVDKDVTDIAWDDNFILAIQSVDDEVNYLIIDVTKNKIYGPFNETTFESKRKELSVNNDLKLVNTEKYKYLEGQMSKSRLDGLDYNLTGVYKLNFDDGVSIKKGTTIIGVNVIGVAWDDNFILEKQSGNNVINYWIIDVNKNRIYGPFNETTFESKRKELNVNSSLKITDTNKYEYLAKPVKQQ